MLNLFMGVLKSIMDNLEFELIKIDAYVSRGKQRQRSIPNMQRQRSSTTKVIVIMLYFI